MDYYLPFQSPYSYVNTTIGASVTMKIYQDTVGKNFLRICSEITLPSVLDLFVWNYYSWNVRSDFSDQKISSQKVFKYNYLFLTSTLDLKYVSRFGV